MGADEGGFSGDLVARVLWGLAGVYKMVGVAYRLNILSSWGSPRHGGGGGGDLRLNQGCLAVRRVFVAASDVLQDPCRAARALQSALPVLQLPLKSFFNIPQHQDSGTARGKLFNRAYSIISLAHSTISEARHPPLEMPDSDLTDETNPVASEKTAQPHTALNLQPRATTTKYKA